MHSRKARDKLWLIDKQQRTRRSTSDGQEWWTIFSRHTVANRKRDEVPRRSASNFDHLRRELVVMRLAGQHSVTVVIDVGSRKIERYCNVRRGHQRDFEKRGMLGFHEEDFSNSLSFFLLFINLK
ncbi:hypothetical protein Csa_006435 [Cucumis sativus]|uniref:Uncharacterized protein n=1 Tax=Cucumis sativus TaxID=3659 RepID=A0A0A0LL48_CUCSA|nr:hypothetical protein Csa_006435 [Cucumis sativus]